MTNQSPSIQLKGDICMEERTESRIEQNDMHFQYKHHGLWLQSVEHKSGGWIPRTLVILPEEEGNGERQLEDPTMFAEREEADKHALLMGKLWVDQKVTKQLADEEIERP
jgi:hypothetical protein